LRIQLSDISGRVVSSMHEMLQARWRIRWATLLNPEF
jgi:hypothetical protein